MAGFSEQMLDRGLSKKLLLKENEGEANADGVQHMDESLVHSAEHDDVAATSQNAMVAYEAPEYRGEPLSMFERQVLSRLC